jgi:hypothetical protein
MVKSWYRRLPRAPPAACGSLRNEVALSTSMTTHDATGAPLVLHLHLAPANFATVFFSTDLLGTRFLICDAPVICASGFVNCPHPRTPSRFLEGGFWCDMMDYDVKQTDSCRFLPNRENPALRGAANALRGRQIHAGNCCRKSHSKSGFERSVGSSPTTGATHEAILRQEPDRLEAHRGPTSPQRLSCSRNRQSDVRFLPEHRVGQKQHTGRNLSSKI